MSTLDPTELRAGSERLGRRLERYRGILTDQRGELVFSCGHQHHHPGSAERCAKRRRTRWQRGDLKR